MEEAGGSASGLGSSRWMRGAGAAPGHRHAKESGGGHAGQRGAQAGWWERTRAAEDSARSLRETPTKRRRKCPPPPAGGLLLGPAAV